MVGRKSRTLLIKKKKRQICIMVYTHIYVYLCVSQRINTKSFTMKGEGLET